MCLPEHGAVDDDGRDGRAVGRTVLQAEALRQHKVELHRRALVLAAEGVAHEDVDRGAVEGAAADVHLHLHAAGQAWLRGGGGRQRHPFSPRFPFPSLEQGVGQVCRRREVPGRPLTFVTTPDFLMHFGLQSRRDLPGIDDLRAAGLLDPVDLALEQLAVEKTDDPD